MPHALAQAMNAFLLLLAAAAALGAADIALQVGLGTAILSGARVGLTVLQLFLALVLLATLALTPVLPRRRLAPLLLLPIALLLAGLPATIALLGEVPTAELFQLTPERIWRAAPGVYALDLAAVLLQGLAAALVFRGNHRRSGGRTWLLDATALRPHRFSWPTTLGCALTGLIAVLVGLPAYAFLVGATAAHSFSGGYVQMRAGGLDMIRKDLVRGDRTVTLIAMMHVGEADFYRGLIAAEGTESAAVLTEGVTDERGRLKERLDYSRMASALGLSTQGEHFRPEGARVNVIRADVDMNDFDPRTIAFLEAVARIHGRGGLDLNEVRRLQQTLEDPAIPAVVLHDILERRNDALMDHLRRALEAYERVIVPWGALHLADIERRLRAEGFQPAAARSRRVVDFRRLARRLAGEGG